jgi:transposase InsO family protein
MALTLISAHHIAAAGFTVQFESNACKILSPAPGWKLIASIAHGLYAIPTQMKESTHVAKLTINELHCTLGHVAQGAMLYTVKQGLIEGVKLDSTSTPKFCDTYTKAKATRQPFTAETRNCAHTYGKLVYTDLWRPAQIENVAGHLYCISFTDDFSQETKVHFLKLKSKALSTLKDYKTELRHQTPGAKIKKLHSDRGGEYLSMEFDRYLKDQGIKCQLTVVTPKSGFGYVT